MTARARRRLFPHIFFYSAEGTCCFYRASIRQIRISQWSKLPIVEKWFICTEDVCSISVFYRNDLLSWECLNQTLKLSEAHFHQHIGPVNSFNEYAVVTVHTQQPKKCLKPPPFRVNIHTKKSNTCGNLCPKRHFVSLHKQCRVKCARVRILHKWTLFCSAPDKCKAIAKWTSLLTHNGQVYTWLNLHQLDDQWKR